MKVTGPKLSIGKLLKKFSNFPREFFIFYRKVALILISIFLANSVKVQVTIP